VYLVTGDSGHGLTHGALGGVLIADLVAGRENPWEHLYDPSRKTIRAAGEYARDNLEVAAEYSRWLAPRGRRREPLLGFGEGAVVRRGRRTLAMYRDFDGTLHERSAVCTHLGCIVRWNSDAHSWDCRCHGSRFAPTGEVLNGPAVSALARVEAPSAVRRRAIRSLARGAAGGFLGTLVMSATMLAQRRRGLLGEPPPKKIVRRVRRRAGLLWAPRRFDHSATLAAHFGFGMAGGALFGLAHRRSRGWAASTLLGAGFAMAVWSASYLGWVPALGLMQPAHRDRPGRPWSMVLAHLVFGSVLGSFVEGMARRDRAGRISVRDSGRARATRSMPGASASPTH
jgi:Rieske Fe-S protein